MASKQCSIAECVKPVLAKSFCSTHYYRFRKRGDPNAPSTKAANWSFPPCSVDGCDRFAEAKGLCHKHYVRSRTSGSPTASRPRHRKGIPHISTKGICTVPECGKPRLYRGVCRLHYYRLNRHGDPLKLIRRRLRKPGEGTFNNGYHFTTVTVNGRRRMIGTHRLVMEQKLGRKLRQNENVHHINGNRSDNRPENLELWIRTQPCGQRQADLVAWAREIISLYGLEVT